MPRSSQEESEQVPLIWEHDADNFDKTANDEGRKLEEGGIQLKQGEVGATGVGDRLWTVWKHPLTKATLLSTLILGILPVFFNDLKEKKPEVPKLDIALDPWKQPIDVPVEVQRSWAQYSPYYAVEKYASVPEGCEVDQASLFPR